MQVERYIFKSAAETQDFAKAFAKELLQKPLGKTAMVLACSGELGAGKTTFTQGFAEGLGVKEKILSPTFVVMKRFPLKTKSFKNFYHFDCYRIESEQDAESLELESILANPENIVLIEWPEKIQKLLPENVLKINFKHINEGGRELTIIK
jgi:tRNA threonylcarbamoyladenosine biosynthesis protein TsaE